MDFKNSRSYNFQAFIVFKLPPFLINWFDFGLNYLFIALYLITQSLGRSTYIHTTSQRLEERIRQHVPKFTRNKIKPQKDLPRRQCKSAQNAPVSADSAIGQHLLNKISAEKFDSTGSLF